MIKILVSAFLVYLYAAVNDAYPADQVPNEVDAQQIYDSDNSDQQEKSDIILKMTCGCKGRDLEHCQRAAKEWEELTGQHVEIITLPTESNERLNLYLQLLRAESQDIDIFLIDVIWPGILFNYFIDLKEYIPEKEISEFFEFNIKNNTICGKLIALPWYVDVGVFYYRKDLLDKYGYEVPKTWNDLERIATDIQKKEKEAGNPRMWGYVFQGKSYEGLTINTVEWFCSAGGGIVNDNGKLIINTESNRSMIKMIQRWIGYIMPFGVLGYTEEEARGVFQSGNAVFMRNWPYVFALLNDQDCPLAGKVGIAPLPSGSGVGSRHVGGLGGWSLGVSKFSKHPEEAVAFIRYLTNYKEQKHRAMESAILPTRPALYKDQELLKARPFFVDLDGILKNAVMRPSSQFGSLYNQASAELFNAVHSMIAGHKPINQVFKQLEKRLSEFLNKTKKQNRNN